MRWMVMMALLLVSSAHAKSEAQYTAEWCGAQGLDYSGAALRFTTPAGRNVYADCIGESVVVEVDFAYKYREGLTQATEYSLLSGKLPVLLLIVEREWDCRYVLDAFWLMVRARLPLKIATTGQSCLPR